MEYICARLMSLSIALEKTLLFITVSRTYTYNPLTPFLMHHVIHYIAVQSSTINQCPPLIFTSGLVEMEDAPTAWELTRAASVNVMTVVQSKNGHLY